MARFQVKGVFKVYNKHRYQVYRASDTTGVVVQQLLEVVVVFCF